MLTSGLDSRLELALLLPVLVDGDALSLVHIPSEIRHARPPGGWESGGCGAWIRTKDLRVMSPTSCRCSTPRFELYPRLFPLPWRAAARVKGEQKPPATGLRAWSRGTSSHSVWRSRSAAPLPRRPSHW